MVRLLTILLLSSVTAFPASWYFDKDASGSNNGTSWANAWQTPGAINWTGMSAGDTLFISGGSTTKDYSALGDISATKYGTKASPITVRVGQDTGHNGVAYFGTNRVGSATSTPYGFVVDGHRGLSYANPTNWYQVETGDWTNNIGFWSHGRTGGTTTDTDPIFSYWTEGADEITYRYYRISGFTNTFSGGGSGLDERGIIFSGVMENIAVTNINFEYLWLHGNSGSQFTFTSATNKFHDGVEISFSKIENNGEDHFKVHGGFTIHECIIGPVIPDDAHCDFFQITGGWFKLYNCYVKESQHSYFRFQSLAGKDPANPLLNGDIWIYNNVFSEIPGRSPWGGTYNEGMVFVNLDSAVANGGYVTWSNVNLFNNTFYGSEINTFQNPDEMARNPFVSWTKGQYVTNAYLKSVRVLNNIFMQKHKGYAFPSTTNVGGVTGAGTWVNYEPFTTNDFTVNTNIFAGTNTSILTDPRVFSYSDVADEIETHTYKFNNKSNSPVFANIATGDFELDATDTAARNAGMNLSSYFTTDSLNRARNVGGAWDIGALEYQGDQGLVMFLSFDNDASNTNATDDSGNGYTGKRFNLTEYSYPSNKIYNASGAPGLTFRPNFTGRYSDFLWRTNNGTYNPTYFDDGSFFAVTNIEAAVTNLSQVTIMTWARYNSASRTDIASPDYSDDGNSQLLSAGTATGTKGSWFLGRYNQRLWLNNTRFVIQTNEGFSGGTSFGTVGDPIIGYGSGNQVIFEFPDRGFDNNGDTTNWYHYAVTFSNGTVRTYFNGAAVTNHTLFSMTVMNIGRSASRPYNWVGVGVNTHVGTPQFENESGTDYPNNGWLNGALDQPRIYSRALTHQEIVDVANSEGAAFADAPSEGGEGSPPTIVTNNASGARVMGFRGLGMSVLPIPSVNTTADLWQTFEFTDPTVANLTANDNTSTGTWLTNDNTVLISTSTTGERALLGTVNGSSDTGHTRGLAKSHTANDTANVQFDLGGSAVTAISAGVWFKFVGPTPNVNKTIFDFSNSGGEIIEVAMEGTSKMVGFVGGADNGVALVSGNFYWITAKVTQNATSYVSVYDTTGALVGTEVSATAGNQTIRYISLGDTLNETVDNSILTYWDDLVLDWTDATYPLGL